MSASPPENCASESQPQMPSVAPSLRDLFVSFLRLGTTAFGGPAMVTYIRQLAVDRKAWLRPHSFDDGVALCQAVPGATAMQMAAYVGLSVRGVAGAVVSFVGFGLPALGLMLTFSIFYARTQNLPAIVSAFGGLQAIVVAIVANAAVSFGQTTLTHWRRVPITGLAVALFGWGLNPFLVVVLAALLGISLLKEEPAVTPADALLTPMPHTTKPMLFAFGVVVMMLLALFQLNRPLYELAMLMIRIDLFAFGGGFSSVPLMFNEIVTVRQWLDGPTLLDGIVLGQVTPGPVVITATFVGYLTHGTSGAVVATLGVFLPSFLIVITAAPHFNRLRTSHIFLRLIGGALCSFPGLLLIVTVHFAQSVKWDLPHILLAGVGFFLLRLGVNILWVVIGGTGLSFLLCR